ncbi:MAG: M14 family zinc carboxypeptidase [candidate division Zixibacteria bacterium]|nr:M14 family zinc carboxypeptidase [candidate division Zixibacteria bacterium]
MRSILKVTLVLLLLLTSVVVATSEKYALIRTLEMTKQQYLTFAEMGMDVVEVHDKSLKVIATESDIAALNTAGIPFEIEQPDLTAFYQSRNKAALTMGGFRTYSEIVAYLDSITATNSDILTQKWSVGTSLEGRDIWAVKLSDNPGVDEEEPEVLYVSLIHAREPAAGASLLNFLEYMVTNYGSDPDITELINSRELYFVPVQNPDGYVYNELESPGGGGMWRKNRRDNGDGTMGVDLNRNYSFKWGYDNLGSSDNTSSETYRGTSAFSEPETDLMRSFIISHEFKIIHNFHTYSNLELWSPSYDRFYSHYEDFYRNLGDSLTQFNGYTPGIGWTLYPTNGDADDWGWGDTISKPRIISMTCEIGNYEDGFWPDPSRIPELISENVWPNLYLAQIADDPYAIGPPQPPYIVDPDSATGTFTLQWQHDDTVNPAVSYRLIEHTDKQTVTDDVESDYGYWETVRMYRTTARSHLGDYSWHTQTQNRSNHWLLSTMPYKVKENDSLCFWIWYDIESDWDYFYAQVSDDGGCMYENLANDFTTNYDPYNQNVGNGITGASGGWVEAKFDLSDYEGKTVLLRLAYYTDSWTYEEGVYIDDFENIDMFASETEIAPSIADTSYDFVDKVAGDYYYRVAATDSDAQESRMSDLFHVNVEQGYIVGDANGSGGINVSDVTYLVSYLFLEGPAPDPIASGDANCSGEVNISDVTFLVSYLFQEGPEPNCP